MRDAQNLAVSIKQLPHFHTAFRSSLFCGFELSTSTSSPSLSKHLCYLPSTRTAYFELEIVATNMLFFFVAVVTEPRWSECMFTICFLWLCERIMPFLYFFSRRVVSRLFSFPLALYAMAHLFSNPLNSVGSMAIDFVCATV